MSCHSLLAWGVSIERSAVSLWESPCVLFVVLPWVYPVWDSLGFLDLGGYFVFHFREIFDYYLLKYFLKCFPFVFLFWDAYDSNIGALTLSQRSLKLSLFPFILFLCSASFISTILSSMSLILSSFSVTLLLVPSRVFLISVIALFTIDLLYFF